MVREALAKNRLKLWENSFIFRLNYLFEMNNRGFLLELFTVALEDISGDRLLLH
jgi:hypothetical protein